MDHKAGYVGIIGLPNSGKSTLLNALLGQKLSIVTEKPQTTRKRILGILSEKDYQIIFLDTPGILMPTYLLQEKMMEAVIQSMKDADILVLIVDIAADPGGEKLTNQKVISNLLNKLKLPKVLLLNKIDLSTQEQVRLLITKLEAMKKFYKVIPISALMGHNIFEVLNSIIENLPKHPKYYPDDIAAEENERFFVSEIIREKIFELYKEEIPYSTEVLVIDFKERDKKKDFIQAEIYVEKESQKGIIIGKQGLTIKKLGEVARTSIEDFLQREVYLDLRVKVKSRWRSDEKMLRQFGYSKDKD